MRSANNQQSVHKMKLIEATQSPPPELLSPAKTTFDEDYETDQQQKNETVTTPVGLPSTNQQKRTSDPDARFISHEIFSQRSNDKSKIIKAAPKSKKA